MSNVIIVGAGMTGLTAARSLKEAGHEVRLLDKSRVVGGRMSSRRFDGAVFDQGAQHISARTAQFAELMEDLRSRNVADVWLRTASLTQPERGVEERYCGLGGMRRIPEALADGLDIVTSRPVDRIDVDAADAFIVTAPVPQTDAILTASGLTVPPELRDITYDATLALMVTLDGPSEIPDGHVAPGEGPVAWIADNQHKGVSRTSAITIHSSAAFAATRLDDEPESWIPELLEAARPHHDGAVRNVLSHRWRYSQPRSTLDVGALLVNGDAPVVIAGEALAGARVEGAFVSGQAAAALTAQLLDEGR